MREAARKTKSNLNSETESLTKQNQKWSLKDFKIGPVIAKGCSAVVYGVKCLLEGFEDQALAMKMMFNFHAESNAQVILKSMQKETIVAQNISVEIDQIKSKNVIVSPHPNIVEMYTAFSDYIPGT